MANPLSEMRHSSPATTMPLSRNPKRLDVDARPFEFGLQRGQQRRHPRGVELPVEQDRPDAVLGDVSAQYVGVVARIEHVLLVADEAGDDLDLIRALAEVLLYPRVDSVEEFAGVLGWLTDDDPAREGVDEVDSRLGLGSGVERTVYRVRDRVPERDRITDRNQDVRPRHSSSSLDATLPERLYASAWPTIVRFLPEKGGQCIKIASVSRYPETPSPDDWSRSPRPRGEN
ncbi:hypothetical protein BRD15_04760 [Halobacteriales archaeon SW_6_65_15]|nr:MAG: hypothetical protein BRD15_04760 [Halobacteriales archaeon SW_6_65_15]